MFRTGCWYRNSGVEPFFWSLMYEWIKYENYQNLDVAKISVFNYIETNYNPVRLHQTLDYRSREQLEKKGLP
jgi:putative transposase